MIRDAATPTGAELDAMADVTASDLRRAAAYWMRTVKPARAGLRMLLDATTINAGPALGPISDE